jgi:hypothetical protein
MRSLLAGVLAAVLAAGCGTTTTAGRRPRAAQTAPTENRVKLAVLPVESDLFPKAANELNQVMRDVHVRGVDDYFLSKASLEVVQLSIECVESSASCYAAVGKSLTAQRLLLGQIAATGTRRRDKGLKVTVTLFDVDGEQAINVADRTFKNEAEALGAMNDLVTEAVARASAPRAAK